MPEGTSGRRPLRAAELVASQIRRRIVAGDLSDGGTLPSESELMREFGVSRPTIREATRILAAQGLITTRRGSRAGALVHPPRPEVAAGAVGLVLAHQDVTLADVYDAHAMIEPACAGQLASTATPSQLRELWRTLDGAPANGGGNGRHLHQLVVELGGNDTIRVLMRMLRTMIGGDQWDCLSMPSANAAQRRRWSDAHRELVLAVDAHDAERAERIWQEHVAEIGAIFVAGPQALLDLLDPPPAAAEPSGPSMSQAVRAWAKARGLEIGERGRIPADVLAAYEADVGADVAAEDQRTAERRGVHTTGSAR